VVLIKGITQPSLDLRSFDKRAEDRTFTLSDIYLSGTVNFAK
jgi:hypothetical protein